MKYDIHVLQVSNKWQTNQESGIFQYTNIFPAAQYYVCI